MTALNKASLFLAAAAVAGLVYFATAEVEPAKLRVIAPSSDLDSEIVGDLAKILNRGSEFELQVSSEQQSGEIALDMLIAGDADLAMVSNYLPYREGIATVMPVYPSVLHLAYRKGRDASSSLALLTDAVVYAGVEGSASRLMFERIAQRIDLSRDDYSYVDELGATADAKPDIIIVFAPISPQRTAELDGYQLYSFGTPDEIGSGSIVDAAALLNPPLRPFVIPASTYGSSNTEAVVAVAVDKMLVVRDDMSASRVYDLISEITRNRPALSATRPGVFSQVKEQFDVSASTFVLHPGTQDFLQREEPTVYERYSGVAEVVVTLMIGFISASFAVVRILTVRRKNRIDEFYAAALVIRERLSSSTTTEERQAAVDELRNLQNTAFTQLVDEKLAADESFQIFITLSNEILAEANNA